MNGIRFADGKLEEFWSEELEVLTMRIRYCYTSDMGTDWYALFDHVTGKLINGYFTLAECHTWYPTITVER